MTWLALSISILAVAMTFFFRSKNKEIALALEASQENEAELTQTLAEILDSDGTVRGQLMLPGQMLTGQAVRELDLARKSMSEMRHQVEKGLDELSRNTNKKVRKLANEAEQLGKDLELSRLEKLELENTLVNLVDKDGEVLAQIRLPGERVYPNKTPCGQLCKFAFEYDNDWHCEVNQNYTCDDSRPEFLDANNQCVMFEREG